MVAQKLNLMPRQLYVSYISIKLETKRGHSNNNNILLTFIVTKGDHVENGLQSPAIDKLNVPSSAITKGALLGKGRFGDILEGTVTGQ